ncbi:junctophilin [Dermatophagoides pteronyssinus]|uniref:junctophilin n=1 Tax=Dermatophagoides pteronyssinus TaxID=6956 RepID=UPI003F673C0E
MAQNYVLPQSTTPTMNNTAGQQNLTTGQTVIGGGRFDFDDGGTYCGGWHDGKAHGHGICTGPKGQGEYSGSWHYGFEVSGIYKWPSGATYEGQWQNGKRHGLGVEYRGKWVYKGEWTQGYKGRYGIRASLLSNARYEGTWANGLQDGYGSETYADGGTYQGQWLRGMRHGYGIRTSAQYGHSSITKMANQQGPNKSSSLQSLDTEGEDPNMQHGERRDACRGGFILVAKVSAAQQQQLRSKRRNSLTEKATSNTSLTGGFLKGLRLRKQRSTGDLDLARNQKSMTPSLRSSREESETRSTGSKDLQASQGDMGSNASFLSQDGEISDPTTVEIYHGEWKNDKRSGFGVCERSDGLRYEGEWYNNKKYGYGVTTFPDGQREEGKYKNNVLITNIRKKHLFMMRSNKLRERIESAVAEAHRAQQIALQKSDIAASRTSTARSKREQADYAASSAQNDSQMAIIIAKQYGGADLAGQGSIAPLRRRLSDFSHVRRMREGQPQQGATGPNMFDQQQQQQQSDSGQFLNPKEPFGGRRGSFRTQLLNNNSNVNHPQHQQGYGYHPSHNQQQQSFGYPNNPNNVQANRFPYPQHSSTGNKDQKDVFQSQAFSDRFDHYQRNDQSPDTSLSARYLSGSRTQLTATPSITPTFNNSTTTGYSTPTPSPSPTFFRPPSPSFHPHHQQQQIPNPNQQSNMIASKPPLSFNSNIQSIPPLKPRNRPPFIDVNSTNINYSIDKSHNNNDNNNTDVGVRHLRTASLYRPGTQLQQQQQSNSSGSSGFKRKPSLQPNASKHFNKPLMSREEASILSHQQREQRRIEQEYRERLSQNPLLYLWSPSVINWLNRQKLVILVFLINVSIAYLFIRMIVS